MCIFSWNTANDLSGVERQIMMLQPTPDVIFIAEASMANANDGGRLLKSMYCIKTARYDGSNSRGDAHVMLIGVKKGLRANFSTLCLATRNALMVQLDGMTVIGVHLDDRRQSGRDVQLEALLQITQSLQKVVIVGDRNMATHGSIIGSCLSVVMPIMRRLSMRQPDQSRSYGWLGLIKSKLGRINSLAT